MEMKTESKGLKKLRTYQSEGLLAPCPNCKCRRYSMCGCELPRKKDVHPAVA